ncbi:MAG: outer membrane lipoprotein carrier protein LolA [Bacteroidales bacterium]|jgi:outer membrane lipoprotein carrier protein|nr:outer membrane lipoprotein carrier protein LolA [Bacteroidales bacterium]
MFPKIIPLFLLAITISGQISAQSFIPATADQKKLMVDKITASSAQLNSLICDFEQVKAMSILNEKMISKGKMYYRNDNSLRWEYLSPSVYVFALNNGKISMKTGDGKTKVIDGGANRFFQEIIKFMMNCINGKGLVDTKDFNISYFNSKDQWKAEMIPQQKEVKKMFSAIYIYFNVKDYSAEKVEMNEPNGDTTTIFLKNKQFNQKIANDKFSLQ